MKPLYFALPIYGYDEKKNAINPCLGTNVIQFDRRWGFDRILTKCEAVCMNASKDSIWSNGYVILYTFDVDRPYALGNKYYLKSYLIKGHEIPPSKRAYLKITGWIENNF